MIGNLLAVPLSYGQEIIKRLLEVKVERCIRLLLTETHLCSLKCSLRSKAMVTVSKMYIDHQLVSLLLIFSLIIEKVWS